MLLRGVSLEAYLKRDGHICCAKHEQSQPGKCLPFRCSLPPLLEHSLHLCVWKNAAILYTGVGEDSWIVAKRTAFHTRPPWRECPSNWCAASKKKSPLPWQVWILFLHVLRGCQGVWWKCSEERLIPTAWSWPWYDTRPTEKWSVTVKGAGRFNLVLGTEPPDTMLETNSLAVIL